MVEKLSLTIIILLLSTALFAETKLERVKRATPLIQAMVRMEAGTVGQKASGYLSKQAREKLNHYANSILAKTEDSDKRRLLHIENPNLHRMICFFVTHFIYAGEEKDLPKELQVYPVMDEMIKRNSHLVAEVRNLQHLFDRCQTLEMTLGPTGFIYFPWDDLNFLNSIATEVALSKELEMPDIPPMFKNDPLLFHLCQRAAVEEEKISRKDHLSAQLQDETVYLLFEGVRSGYEEERKINLTKIAAAFVKKAGQEIGSKIAKRLWEKRHAIVSTLVRDDTNLFRAPSSVEETAQRLTNLVAVPNSAVVSQKSFVESLKGILGKDAKVKISVGKDKIYGGLSVSFK